MNDMHFIEFLTLFIDEMHDLKLFFVFNRN